MTTDRERLAATFNSAADLYQQARPEYPAELYEELISSAGLASGDHLLEIGCASGKATIPLTRRGFRMTAVEFGAELATVARQNLKSFPRAEIVQANFETWEPPPGTRFALVFAATAWHWIDPDLRYQKAWSLLRPGGHLAFWNAAHVIPAGGDPFFREIQEVYEKIGEGLPQDAVWPRPGELPDEREDIARSGLFEPVVIRQFSWEISYDAESYIRLLDTFSGHIAMAPWQREHLYSEIRTGWLQDPAATFAATGARSSTSHAASATPDREPRSRRPQPAYPCPPRTSLGGGAPGSCAGGGGTVHIQSRSRSSS